MSAFKYFQRIVKLLQSSTIDLLNSMMVLEKGVVAIEMYIYRICGDPEKKELFATHIFKI